MSENSTGVTVTLKAGTGYEAPWIVIHAENVADAKNQIDTGDFAALAERTVAAAEFFRAAHNVKTGLPAGGGQRLAQGSSFGGGDHGLNAPAQQSWSNQGSQQQYQPQQAAPQGAPAQGGGAPPPTKWDLSGPPTAPEQCIHGQMQWKHRVAKGSGKEYRGWFCTKPKEQGGCDAKFLR